MSQSKSETKQSASQAQASQTTAPVKFDLNKDKLFGLTGFTTMAVTTN
jgi:hypothetical protein